MDIIMYVMLLWFTSFHIFKVTLNVQALYASGHGATYSSGLPVIENSYPGYIKKIPQLLDYIKILQGYFVCEFANNHVRYLIKNI